MSRTRTQIPIMTRDDCMYQVDQDIASFGFVPLPFSFTRQAVEGEAGTSVQAVSDSERPPISGVASVEEVSRTAYKILIKGMEIDHYNQFNPVVLASHIPVSYASMMPGVIATVEKVSKRGQTLAFKNMTFDTDPLSESWYRKISGRFVRMVSIGIIPIEVHWIEEQIGTGKNARTVCYLEFTRSELTEISPVAVGANRGALIVPPKSSKGESANDSVNRQLVEAQTQIAALRRSLDEVTAIIQADKQSQANKLRAELLGCLKN